MNTTPSPTPATPVTDYTAVIARHKLSVAAFAVVGTALALTHTAVLAEPSYESHAKVVVRPVSEAVQPPGVDRLVAMGTEREIATSAAVASVVKDSLQSAETLDRLQRRVSASVVGSTQRRDEQRHRLKECSVEISQ